MFSFHKPKVYRSTSGCCICKAKSSSSRFTDSCKYEDDLMECFKLGEKRTGEICNACVLLVKRWKKLPVGSTRHWRHVVDYRAGPGSKSLARSKTRSKKRPKLKAEARAASPGGDDDLSSDLSVLSVLSGPSSPVGVVVSPDSPPRPPSRKRTQPQKLNDTEPSSELIDLTFWKRKKVCCGVIFTGPGGLVMIDPRLLKPCCGSCGAAAPRSPTHQPIVDQPSSSPPIIDDHAAIHSPMSDESRSSPPMSDESRSSPPITDLATHGVPCTIISDSSSDSGYDECSNPAVVVAVPAN